MNLYHHLVETLKFAGGQRWRLWDPRSHPEVQVRCPGLVGSPVPAPGLRVRPVSPLPTNHKCLAGEARGT